MAADEQTRKSPSTDNQDTVVLGSAPAATPAGTLLNNRYLLIRQLSEGGFGTVYLAQDQQMHGREVVVKIQINQKVNDPWFERKFSEEVRALSMIDHPGVVVAIDSGRTPDGKPFLVMQYVDGVTLRGVMNPEGMPLDRAAEILKQVGHALAAAHAKGIWHRDLKPENLMLQPSPGGGERVRLIDFGIATVADIKSKIETSTRVAGSMQYMAPEQSLGHPSAQTDIYAMGLIAYEMVTGRRPFIAENAVQLDGLQRSGVRVRPSDLRPSLPLPAERLIMQSLEYEPSRRPHDARAFGDQLHDALVGSEVTRITTSPPPPPGAPPPPPTVVRKKKLWVGLIIAAGFMIWSKVFDEPGTRPKPAKRAVPAEDRISAKDSNSEQAVELAFWDSVKDSNEPELYSEYLAKYPDGRFESLAKAKLAILARKEKQKTGSVKAIGNQANEDQVELAFWNSVKDSKEPRLYQDYLDRYPHGQFESLARTKLNLLTQSGQPKVPRAPASPVIPGIPDLEKLGVFSPQMSAELADFTALKDVTDPQPYRDFLAKHPRGMFANVARLKLAAIEKKAAAPQ